MHQIFSMVLLLHQLSWVDGHGRLVDPPSRASMWRYGYNTPPDYNDNQGFCGGREHQIKNGGKCGICGDPWDAYPRNHEARGIFANGIIVKNYTVGQVISVSVQITANHLGYFEFRLCVNNDVKNAATHECLDKNVLELANGSGTKFHIDSQNGYKHIDLKLPQNVNCTQCVFQWKYHTGNNWGNDDTGSSCQGCGSQQEQFYACSDIAISGGGTPPVQITDSTPEVTSTHAPFVQTSPEVTSLTPEVTSTIPPISGVISTNVPVTTTDEQLCHATRGNTIFDEWCVNNCARGYCPVDTCICDGKKTTPLQCMSYGIFKTSANDIWCQTNCKRGNCPSSHCKCKTN